MLRRAPHQKQNDAGFRLFWRRRTSGQQSITQERQTDKPCAGGPQNLSSRESIAELD
jgi:hypothetical protein